MTVEKYRQLELKHLYISIMRFGALAGLLVTIAVGTLTVGELLTLQDIGQALPGATGTLFSSLTPIFLLFFVGVVGVGGLCAVEWSQIK